MNEDGPLFILAGNGAYTNLGCEAIVRGTVKILREHFRDPRFVCLSHFQSEEQYKMQRMQETDGAIMHLTSRLPTKKKIIKNLWRPDTWGSIYRYLIKKDAFYTGAYKDMIPYLDEAEVVLSVGGDNYSLDYGVPTLFTTLDDFVLEHNRPIVLWGASVGPFSSMPNYERYMGDHLHKVTGIFARESATVEYLNSIGVHENVYPVADPAFLMDAVQPDEKLYIDEGAIGLNLSPMMAKFVTGGDMEQWTKIAAAIIAEVVRRTERKVYLISHVTNPNSNDYTFMQRTVSLMAGEKDKITLIPPIYNAEQTKWIIGQMAVFAGARTHSTIAALSSGVPTLSFAYSIKATGINRDLFGHTDYCRGPLNLNTEAVSDRIE
ncbi:polysaccharide pyruvyl transferase family protein, partial [Methanothrix sp.]